MDGESFSEVRVNGVPIEEAAGALDACSWPRFEQELAIVRVFALLVHPDEEVVRCGQKKREQRCR